MDIYEGPAQLQIGSKTLAQADSVRIRFMSNNNPVFTMRLGLNGHSKGPNQTEISVTNAVPKAGLEDDYVEKILGGDYFFITYVMAGKRYRVECWMDDGEGSAGSREAAEFSFNCIGGPPTIR